MWELLTGEEPYASMHYGAIIGLKLTFHVFLSMIYFSFVDIDAWIMSVMAISERGFSSCILLPFCIALFLKMFPRLIAYEMSVSYVTGGIVNNTLRPSIPTWCDPLWKSLMEKCWSAEPASRPSFSEVASELRVMATALQPKAHG